MSNQTCYLTAEEAKVYPPDGALMIAVKYGERGYWPIRLYNVVDQESARAMVDKLNRNKNVDREKALIGSMFGWDCPAAQGAFGGVPA